MITYGEPMTPDAPLGPLGPQVFSVLDGQTDIWPLLPAYRGNEGQNAIGLLGPGNLPPTYIPIEDWSAHEHACQEVGHQPKTPAEDLKKARELGEKLGRVHRHPLALAASRGLKVFSASLEWLAAAYSSPPGHQTVGLASKSTKEIFYSAEHPHRTQLSIIAHEVGHFLDRAADENWCEAFARGFLLGCAAKCYMGNLNLLELKQTGGDLRPKLKVA